ncbi:hypothetical protein JKP88DRAFT_272970 [Tribonema minus]|uniref:Uncharacterized protein n=1 Tax=Tribonema minus TaxID=303371 RepID=A0A836CE19_9STRA|nr:hypothetical protein JKP88DRAFT_272970 [Tribonema minus]
MSTRSRARAGVGVIDPLIEGFAYLTLGETGKRAQLNRKHRLHTMYALGSRGKRGLKFADSHPLTSPFGDRHILLWQQADIVRDIVTNATVQGPMKAWAELVAGKTPAASVGDPPGTLTLPTWNDGIEELMSGLLPQLQELFITVPEDFESDFAFRASGSVIFDTSAALSVCLPRDVVAHRIDISQDLAEYVDLTWLPDVIAISQSPAHIEVSAQRTTVDWGAVLDAVERKLECERVGHGIILELVVESDERCAIDARAAAARRDYVADPGMTTSWKSVLGGKICIQNVGGTRDGLQVRALKF